MILRLCAIGWLSAAVIVTATSAAAEDDARPPVGLGTLAIEGTVCGAPELIRRMLSEAGRRSSVSLAFNGMVVERYTRQDGAWVLLFINPDGMACLAADGESWEEIPEPKGAST